MDKMQEICEYLRKYHTGQEKAIHAKELQKIFSAGNRTVRHYIHTLRLSGVPICSDANGYYYAHKQSEINSTVKRLDLLERKISTSKTGLQNTVISDYNCPQLTININVYGGNYCD